MNTQLGSEHRSGDHGRRLRYINNILENTEEPGHKWNSEDWDNIRILEAPEDQETKDNRD